MLSLGNIWENPCLACSHVTRENAVLKPPVSRNEAWVPKFILALIALRTCSPDQRRLIYTLSSPLTELRAGSPCECYEVD